MLWVLLAFIGLFVGAFGTLIGAAGGFLLVPVLLFLFPNESPSTITSITLTVAFFNAFSGSIAYGHLKRIDYRSGIFFSMASVPGAVIGAGLTHMLNRNLFQIIFGLTLLAVATYLLIKPERHFMANARLVGHTTRKIMHRDGTTSAYSFNLITGIAISFGVGLISGLLGIGGGIIHVPALTQVLGFPAHVATATSHFVVAITTFSATGVHVVTGGFAQGIRRAAVLSAGAVIGAQFGARLSHNVSEKWIVRLLAIGLALVAVRLLIAPF